MRSNNLSQTFTNNSEAEAWGSATCRLCNNGKMTCDVNVYGGKTLLIASHIHIADNGNGSTSTGDPVINFCGTNGQGSVDDGTPYSAPCTGYNDSDVSENLGMGGRKVGKFTKDLTLEQMVYHID